MTKPRHELLVPIATYSTPEDLETVRALVARIALDPADEIDLATMLGLIEPEAKPAPAPSRPPFSRICQRHGMEKRRQTNGAWRCLYCRREATAKWSAQRREQP